MIGFLFPHTILNVCVSRLCGFQVVQILSIIPITIQLEMIDVVNFLQIRRDKEKEKPRLPKGFIFALTATVNDICPTPRG